MRRIVKDVTGLFFHACLPSIPEVNDNPFRFTFTLDIDTNVADLITEVLHELHYAENKHSYKFIAYWKNKLNELLAAAEEAAKNEAAKNENKGDAEEGTENAEGTVTE